MKGAIRIPDGQSATGGPTAGSERARNGGNPSGGAALKLLEMLHIGAVDSCAPGKV